jgi:transcriptional regulator with XRE-family HTH domain
MSEKIEKRGRPRKWRGPLADWIKSAGVRIDKLADELNVDEGTVYRWLRSELAPSIRQAIAIAEIARRSGTTLQLEDFSIQRGRTIHEHEEKKHYGVLPRPTAQTGNRRLATATK